MTDYVPPPGVPVHCCACGESFEVSDDPHAVYPLNNGICHGCWKLIRRPNHAIVAENRRLTEKVEELRETLAGLLIYARGNQHVLDKIHKALDAR